MTKEIIYRANVKAALEFEFDIASVDVPRDIVLRDIKEEFEQVALSRGGKANVKVTLREKPQ